MMFDSALLSIGDYNQDASFSAGSNHLSNGVDVSYDDEMLCIADDGSVYAVEFGSSSTGVYVFDSSGTELLHLSGSGIYTGATTKGCTLSGDGSRLFVQDPTYNTNVGRIHVYSDSGGSPSGWGSEQTITPNSATQPGSYGIATNYAGDLLVFVGVAKVEVWTRSGTTWSHHQTLTNSGLFGGVFKVGERCTDDRFVLYGESIAGFDYEVHIMKETAGTWASEDNITGFDNGDVIHDASISRDGNSLIVHIESQDLHRYTRSGSTWTELESKFLTGASSVLHILTSSELTRVSIGEKLYEHTGWNDYELLNTWTSGTSVICTEDMSLVISSNDNATTGWTRPETYTRGTV